MIRAACRRWGLWVLLLVAACGPRPDGDPTASSAPTVEPGWVVSWATAAYNAGPLARGSVFEDGLDDQTVRNVARLSTGGSQIRLRLSNRLGLEPTTFDAVTVARGTGGSTADAATLRRVTFAGRDRVSVEAGGQAVSDPVDLEIGGGQDVVVSLYAAGATGAVTGHRGGGQTVYVSGPGDHTMSPDGTAFTDHARGWLFLEAVDVLAPARVRGAIVALGDSTTIGAASTVDENRRWTDVVARRLANRDEAEPTFSIVNLAISGNRMLSDSPCFGESALARFERDVLAQTGVVAVVLLEGVNDLGHPDGLATASDRIRPCIAAPVVSADEMMTAYLGLAEAARAGGLRIYGGTILPYGGNPSWTPAAEGTRHAINQAILADGVFDGVIDFAAAVVDPEDPTQMAPAFDSGDGLHPGDAGYRAMGDAVDLSLFDPLLAQ